MKASTRTPKKCIEMEMFWLKKSGHMKSIFNEIMHLYQLKSLKFSKNWSQKRSKNADFIKALKLLEKTCIKIPTLRFFFVGVDR